MKKSLIFACFTLVAFAIPTPQAQAGQFYFGFGGGYYYGGYAPGYYWGYPAPPAAYYPYSAYRYPFAVPYGSPFVTYGYVRPPRLYPQPLFWGYTLYPRRVYRAPAPRRGVVYGDYVPRFYPRYR